MVGVAAHLDRLVGQQRAGDPRASSGRLQASRQGQQCSGPGADVPDDGGHLAGLQGQVDRSDQAVHRQSLGVDGLDVPGAGPVGQRELVRQSLALDVQAGQQAVQPAGQPPGPVAEQLQHGRDERHPDDEGVHRDADGEGEGDRLDRALALGDEEGEDDEHDHGSCGDDRAGADEALLDRLTGAASVHVLLTDSADQEDLVVHRQAEQDAHQQDRQEADHRHRAFQVHQLLAPALVEDQRGEAEGDADAEQVADGRLQRHVDRAEDHRQQDERQADHEDAEGQQRLGQLAGDVNLDRGTAGDPRVDAIGVQPVLVLRDQRVDDVLGGGVVRRGGRDDLDETGVGVLIGQGRGDGRDTGQLLDVGLEAVHHPHRVGGGEQVGGDDQGPVGAGAEVLGHRVVARPRGASQRTLAGIGQRHGQVAGGPAERGDPDQDDQDRQPRELCDGAHPASEEARLGGVRTGLALGDGVLGTHPFAQEAHHRGQQGEGDDDGEGDAERGEQTHRGEEGHPAQAEADQGDHHGQAGEDDRRSGGGNRAGRRLLDVQSVGELLAVAAQDEQGVVDADGQAQHHSQHRRGGHDRREAGEDHHDADGQADADQRGQDRQARGDQRPKGEGEHDEGNDHAGGLGDREGGDADRVGLATHRDRRAGRQVGRDLVRDLDQGLALVVLEGVHRALELQLDDARPAVVADQAVDVLAPRLGRALHEAGGLELVDAAGDGGLDLGVGDLRALGQFDERGGAKCRDLGEGHPELGECFLRGCAGDRELVLPGAAHCHREGAQQDECRQPQREHAPVEAVAPLADLVQEPRHCPTPTSRTVLNPTGQVGYSSVSDTGVYSHRSGTQIERRT